MENIQTYQGPMRRLPMHRSHVALKTFPPTVSAFKKMIINEHHNELKALDRIITDTHINDCRKVGMSEEQMCEVFNGLDGGRNQDLDVETFFRFNSPETLKTLNHFQMSAMISGIGNSNQNVKGFFRENMLEIAKKFDAVQIFSLIEGLKNSNPNVLNFFKEKSVETLKELDGSQMTQIRIGLRSANENVVNFFKEHNTKSLKWLSTPMLEQIRNDENILNQVIMERNKARQNYYDNAPEDISQSQLEQNMSGLLFDEIQEVIKYTKRTIQAPENGGFGWTAKQAYAQKIDQNQFQKEANRLRAGGGMVGVLSSIPKDNKYYALSQLPEETQRLIGKFFGDARIIAGVNRASRDAARQVCKLQEDTP